MTTRSIFPPRDCQPYRRLSGRKSKLLSCTLHSGSGYSSAQMAELSWRLV
jgi:hypothetical protein